MAFNPNDHLMNLKGKSYLMVMWRLVWFREEKPLWNIETKLERLEENHAIFSAKIYDEAGIQKSSGYGSEGIKDFPDFIEKAETKAVGRALAMLGYGTQFAPEMDEGDRIVDTPTNAPSQKQSGGQQSSRAAEQQYADKNAKDALFAACGNDRSRYDALMREYGLLSDDGKYAKIPMSIYNAMYKEAFDVSGRLPWEE